MGTRTGVPQNEGVMDVMRTSSALGTLDTAVPVWIGAEEFEGAWGAGGRMPSVTAVGWAWSSQAKVKQHVPKTEQQLEGLDEALTWHLSVQHALGSGYLAA